MLRNGIFPLFSLHATQRHNNRCLSPFNSSIFISVVVLSTLSVSANGFSEMKGGADNNPQCQDVNFETSSKEVAKQLLDAAIPRIHELTEDEEGRSALKEVFLTFGPGALNQFILEGMFRKPLECLPMECRGVAKLVIFKRFLKSNTDGVLRDFATEWKGNGQYKESTSDDDRDKEIIRDEEIQVMQKIEVDLGEVLTSELLARFNECLQQAFLQNEAISNRAFLTINDPDKVLSEDEVRTISEIVGEAQSKVWWHRVSQPTVNVSELKRDARKKASLELKDKASDRALPLTEKLLLDRFE